MQELLVKNGLDTIDKSKDDIPIVIQSFEIPALVYFSKINDDLPRTLVMGVDHDNIFQSFYKFLYGLVVKKPYLNWGISPDWLELSKIVSGTSPGHQYVTKPGSPLDPMSDDWDRSTIRETHSDMVKLLHSLDLAVHPWPLQDDNLHYLKKAYSETKLYLN